MSKRGASGPGSERDLLSKRGRVALSTPAPDLSGAANCHLRTDIPRRLLDVAVAENRLTQDMLEKRTAPAFANIPRSSFSYNPWPGRPSLRESIAAFMREHFCKDSASAGPVADEIVCLAGAAAVLAHVSFCLCDPGDACLVPLPYSWAYDTDLIPLAEIKLIPVPLPQHDGYRLSPDMLDAACKQAEIATGRFPRMLLLTNPSNPLGRVSPRSELQAVVDWCDRHDVHLVVDEVYALGCSANPAQTRKVTPQKFASIGEMVKGQLGPRRHVVWALSKDFGAAGWRAGVLWTQNQGLLNTFARNMAKFACLSAPVQSVVEELLNDRDFVASYLEETRKRLESSCNIAMLALQAMELPYLEPDAGVFIWCDCRSLLPKALATDPQASKEAEASLCMTLRQEAGILMTPGMALHHKEPGWFRLCYAAVSRAELERGMHRFKEWVCSQKGA